MKKTTLKSIIVMFVILVVTISIFTYTLLVKAQTLTENNESLKNESNKLANNYRNLKIEHFKLEEEHIKLKDIIETISQYEQIPNKLITNPKQTELSKGIIFTSFEGLKNHYEKKEIIIYEGEEEKMFELHTDDKYLKDALKPLINKIKERTNPEIQNHDLLIATDIIQSIPYDKKLADCKECRNKTPYEVLYNNKATCGGKSYLLAYILKELGYGVVLFYFDNKKTGEEGHLAVGVKCENEEYKDGHCYIETTNKEFKIGEEPPTLEKLNFNVTIPVSEGKSYNGV